MLTLHINNYHVKDGLGTMEIYYKMLNTYKIKIHEEKGHC